MIYMQGSQWNQRQQHSNGQCKHSRTGKASMQRREVRAEHKWQANNK